jgi:RHS repeat-associated protein
MWVQPTSGGTAVATYAFDGRGKRSVKVAVQQSGANRTFTIHAGTTIISEFNDASTATYTTGTTPGQAPSDTVSTLLYHHQDHLTTRATTDQQGNVATQRGHYPYGDFWYETGGQAMASVSRKFTKYMVEPEMSSSVVHSATYRQHSARIGRFQTPDRARGDIFAPQRLNRYSYVRNDPVNRWDPKGLDDSPFAIDDDGGGGGGGGGSGDGGGGGGGGDPGAGGFGPNFTPASESGGFMPYGPPMGGGGWLGDTLAGPELIGGGFASPRDDCYRYAADHTIQCLKSVNRALVVGAAGCLALCIPSIPSGPGYPACVTSCFGTILAGAIGYDVFVCWGSYAFEAVLCDLKYGYD